MSVLLIIVCLDHTSNVKCSRIRRGEELLTSVIPDSPLPRHIDTADLDVFQYRVSLPLNCGGWFPGYIVNHTIDAANFVDDAIGYLA